MTNNSSGKVKPPAIVMIVAGVINARVGFLVLLSGFLRLPVMSQKEPPLPVNEAEKSVIWSGRVPVTWSVYGKRSGFSNHRSKKRFSAAAARLVNFDDPIGEEFMKYYILKPLFLFIFAAFCLTTQVSAQLEGNPENICRNGAFTRESKIYKLARITGKKGERAYFYGDEREDCPSGKDCRQKSYVIPGDGIIVSRTFGDYTCGWFQPVKGAETVGWIKTENLEWVETNRNPSEKDWLGDWRFYDNSVVISKSKTPGLLDIKGEAIWKGLGDNVHVGELDHSAKPVENFMKLGEDDTDFDCKVTMQLLGKYLIVSDNMNCGGMNVTFSGIYQKKR